MTIKNTIVIWDTCGEDEIKFFVVEKDISHLNNVYINSSSTTEEKEDELNQYMPEEGLHMVDSFPYSQYISMETAVIVCGFIP